MNQHLIMDQILENLAGPILKSRVVMLQNQR